MSNKMDDHMSFLHGLDGCMIGNIVRVKDDKDGMFYRHIVTAESFSRPTLIESHGLLIDNYSLQKELGFTCTDDKDPFISILGTGIYTKFTLIPPGKLGPWQNKWIHFRQHEKTLFSSFEYIHEIQNYIQIVYGVDLLEMML
jgi:hypothetical protein